ncbi:MAG: alpha-amylase family glycosyl hydrolase, partial [Longimicrobiales bacterium]|nr:alpha-amylase family glycosyl hydrolase [Longimicrobiales bacterium]
TEQMVRLVQVLADGYIDRSESLERSDIEREGNHNWFLSQEWVGVSLYSGGFATDLQGVREKLPYLQELGVNMVHVMPVLRCPEDASDGGYAVSDFREIDPSIGTLEDLRELAEAVHARGMLLTLDVVANHTSDQHEWARRACAGEVEYQDYYYVYDDRTTPDMFEETMPEIFPETAPGNFTWDEAMGKWVMTVFNDYQWDLNYRNPAVLIEMIAIILFWADKGADIVRLDAVAFLWKRIGSTGQNEREAHLILQLMKDCCQVAAPGVLFIAEAIVAPVEITKYFGEDAVIAKECEIAYNATFMALLWDAVATCSARLLEIGIRNLPTKLDRATWLNYIRCHDDIGLGFDDLDIEAAGFDPAAHRRFLVDYFTGSYADSPARGMPFGVNDRTGDARISGSLASLAGLESALEADDQAGVERAIRIILLLHGMILSFGGIPLLYYGDELGTQNDYSFQDDPAKAGDSRWMHRPDIDWDRAERRHRRGSVEQRIFDGLKRAIAVRKTLPAFADFNNRELIATSNPHLFAFWRTDPEYGDGAILVVANFDGEAQHLELSDLGNRGMFGHGDGVDLLSGEVPARVEDQLMIPAHGFYWLTDR